MLMDVDARAFFVLSSTIIRALEGRYRFGHWCESYD